MSLKTVVSGWWLVVSKNKSKCEGPAADGGQRYVN